MRVEVGRMRTRVIGSKLGVVLVCAAVGVASLVAPRGADGTGRNAQDATVRSTPREEVARQLTDRFPMSDPARDGGTVIMGGQGDLTTLNAMFADDTVTAYTTGLVYESLVDLSPIDGAIVPRLADAYEVA